MMDNWLIESDIYVNINNFFYLDGLLMLWVLFNNYCRKIQNPLPKFIHVYLIGISLLPSYMHGLQKETIFLYITFLRSLLTSLDLVSSDNSSIGLGVTGTRGLGFWGMSQRDGHFFWAFSCDTCRKLRNSGQLRKKNKLISWRRRSLIWIYGWKYFSVLDW